MTTADPIEEQRHRQQLVAILQRRLRILDLQLAHFGSAEAPAHLVIEREDTNNNLEAALNELRRLGCLTPGENPYPGLRTFTEDEASQFFGRDALVDTLCKRVGSAPLLAVLGPSGSGKSSAVRAGLVPWLKAGALPSSQDWVYLPVITPTARPLDQLAQTLAATNTPGLGNLWTLKEQLAATGDALVRAADLLLATRPPTARVLLVVDQFEELWTLTAADAGLWSQKHAAFIDLLLCVLKVPNARLSIVVTMRADFVHRAAEHRALADALADYDVLVGPMTEDEVRATIERPAKNSGLTFEPGLVEEFVDQTAGRPGMLPLLAYTLHALCAADARRDALSWDTYRLIGGVEGGLGSGADQLLVQHYADEARRQRLSAVLLRLVQPGEGTPDTRRNLRLSELTPADMSPDELQQLLQPLIDARLLVSDAPDMGRASEATLTLAHEALIRAWPTLQQWISNARKDLRTQLELEQAAREWQANAQSSDYLWAGLRLANLEAWISERRPVLGTREQGFFETCLAAEQRRTSEAAQAQHEREELLKARAEEQQRRAEAEQRRAEEQIIAAQRLAETRRRSIVSLRRWLVGLGTLTLLTAGTMWFAFDQLRRTTAQQLALSALNMRDAPETALLLAYEGLARDVTPFTEETFRTALERVTWVPRSIAAPPLPLRDLGWSSATQRIATASEDGTVRLWGSDGSLLRVLEGHTDPLTALAFALDGRLATASADGTARLWDVEDNLASVLKGHTDPLTALAFAPDGRLATASADGTARLWDAEGNLLAVLEGHSGPLTALAFALDGRLATASADGTARLWDAEGNLLAVLEGHSGPLTALAFSFNGRRLVTGGQDNTARLWDEDGSFITVLKAHIAAVRCVVFSPSGTYLLTSGDDGIVYVWGANGGARGQFNAHQTAIHDLVFGDDDEQFLTVSSDGSARLWHLSDVTDNTSYRRIDTPLAILESAGGALIGATFLQTNHTIVTAAADGTIRLWHASGSPLPTLQGHEDDVWHAIYSDDGSEIVSASNDGTVRLWNSEGQPLERFGSMSRNGPVWAVDIDHDQKQLAVALDGGRVLVWQRGSQEPRELIVCADQVWSAVFSPSGSALVTGCRDGSVALWLLDSGDRTPFIYHKRAVYTVAFSHDGQHIATASADGDAVLWNTRGGIEHVFAAGSSVSLVEFSFDGRRLLTAGDNVAQIWSLDPPSDRPLTVITHTAAAIAIRAAFTPDAQRVVTTAEDKVARVWSSDGTLLTTIPLPGKPWAVAVHPSGERMLVAFEDGSVRQYLLELDAARALELAACRVGRSLSDEERRRYGLNFFDRPYLKPARIPCRTSAD